MVRTISGRSARAKLQPSASVATASMRMTAARLMGRRRSARPVDDPCADGVEDGIGIAQSGPEVEGYCRKSRLHGFQQPRHVLLEVATLREEHRHDGNPAALPRYQP